MANGNGAGNGLEMESQRGAQCLTARQLEMLEGRWRETREG